MILVTHSLVGTALAHRSTSYLAVFVVAFVSHYIFDMIPHWHYPSPRIKDAVTGPFGKKTMRLQWKYIPEMIRIAIDLLLGVGLSLAFFPATRETILIAAIGAVLPDLLVGFSKFYPLRPLVWHDRFHRWNHTAIRLDDRPLLGIGSQIAIAAIFVWLFR